jgi:hypothetical protein
MAEDKPQDATEGGESAKPAQAATPPQQVQAAPQVQLDDSQIDSCYANFCRVTGTPEELIIDFGLNTQPVGVPDKPIKVSQRIILNHYTAKRLLAALSMSVQRHEAAFGVLETDVRKRVQVPGVK